MVQVVDDSLALEGNEQFVVNITSVSDERVLLCGNSTSNVSIKDDDGWCSGREMVLQCVSLYIILSCHRVCC